MALSITSVSPNRVNYTNGDTVDVYGSGFSQYTYFSVGYNYYNAYGVRSFQYIDQGHVRIGMPFFPSSYLNQQISLFCFDDPNGDGGQSAQLSNCFTLVDATQTPTQNPNNTTPSPTTSPVAAPADGSPYITNISPATITWSSNVNTWPSISVTIGNVPSSFTVAGFKMNSEKYSTEIDLGYDSYDSATNTFKLSIPIFAIIDNPTSTRGLKLIFEVFAGGVATGNRSNSDRPLYVAPQGTVVTSQKMVINDTVPLNNAVLDANVTQFITVTGQNFPINMGSISTYVLGKKGLSLLEINGTSYNFSQLDPTNDANTFKIKIPQGISDGSTVNLHISYFDDDVSNGGQVQNFNRSYTYKANALAQPVGDPVFNSLSYSTITWGGNPVAIDISGQNFTSDMRVNYIWVDQNGISQYLGFTDPLVFINNNTLRISSFDTKRFYPNTISDSQYMWVYLWIPKLSKYISAPGFNSRIIINPPNTPVTTNMSIGNIKIVDQKTGVQDTSGLVHDGGVKVITVSGTALPIVASQNIGDSGSGIVVYRNGQKLNQPSLKGSATDGWTKIYLVNNAQEAQGSNLKAYRNDNDNSITWIYDTQKAIADSSQNPFYYNGSFQDNRTWEVSVYQYPTTDSFGNYVPEKESAPFNFKTSPVPPPPNLTIDSIDKTQGGFSDRITIKGSGFRASETNVTRRVILFPDNKFVTTQALAEGKNVSVVNDTTLNFEMPGSPPLTDGQKLYIQLRVGTQIANWTGGYYTAKRVTSLDSKVSIIGASRSSADSTTTPRPSIEISGSGIKTGGKIWFGVQGDENNTSTYLLNGENGSPITSLTEGVNIFNNGTLIKGWIPKSSSVNTSAVFGAKIWYKDPDSGSVFAIPAFTFYYIPDRAGGGVKAYLSSPSGDTGQPITLTGVSGTQFNVDDIQDITIDGSPTKSIIFGDNYVINPVKTSPSSVQFTLPPNQPGVVDVIVLFKPGTPGSAAEIKDAYGNDLKFTYVDNDQLPYISAVTPPNQGSGNVVTIFGGNFNSDKDKFQIKFGAVTVLPENIININPDSIILNLPAQPSSSTALVSVYYVGQGAFDTNTSASYKSASQYQYGNPTPIINNISPANGVVQGGYQVDIFGSNFVPNSKIYFGTVQSNAVNFKSASQYTVTVPPSVSGASQVAVKMDYTINGVNGSYSTAIGAFVYTDAAAPTQGGGGTTGGATVGSGAIIIGGRTNGKTAGGIVGDTPIELIDVDGKYFGTTKPIVRFDGQATPVAPDAPTVSGSSKKIFVLEPKHVPGLVDITISWPEEPTRNMITVKGIFTYVAPTSSNIPIIYSVVGPDGQPSGSAAGGESLTITGDNFYQSGNVNVSVLFSTTPSDFTQGIPAEDPQVINNNIIRCKSPASMTIGSYWVTVKYS
jgi:hypothetical protein